MHKLFHKDGESGETHKHTTSIITPKSELRFEDFLNLFPPIELPFSITSDTERTIAKVHDPLHPAWVTRFLLDPENLDEYTEFMPCFSIPNTEKFVGLVYWQASLEGSAYFLTTFSKSGNIIDQKIIAGTLYLKNAMVQMVCSIAEDWSILRSEAELTAQGEINKAVEPKTKFIQMTLEGELLED